MAATVYAPIQEVEVPRFIAREPYEDYLKREGKYLKDAKKALKERGFGGKNFGEILKFQVADGYARYMVVSMRPLRLMHLPLDDAYNFPYAHLLTAKEVNNQLAVQKKWDELFSSKM